MRSTMNKRLEDNSKVSAAQPTDDEKSKSNLQVSVDMIDPDSHLGVNKLALPNPILNSNNSARNSSARNASARDNSARNASARASQNSN